MFLHSMFYTSRTLRLLLLLGLAGLLLPGCPPDDGSVPRVESGLASNSRLSKRNDHSNRRIAEQLIRVCTILPSTGSAAKTGAEIRRGMAIAQAEVRGQDWRRRRLEWIEKDTDSTEAGALAAYHACLGEGVNVIVGPVDPGAISALIPVAAAHEPMLIIPEIGAVEPPTWADHLFAVAPPKMEMGHLAGEDAAGTRQLRLGAYLHPGDVFGQTLTSAFEKSFQQSGGELVSRQELDPMKAETWRWAALEAGRSGAEALFVVGPPRAAASIVGALTEPPLEKTHVWFIDWAMIPTVLDPAAASTRWRVHWVNRHLPNGTFAETYLTRYQAKPRYAAGSGYDAVLFAAEAIESAKGPIEGPAQIAAAARRLKELKGAFGETAVIRQRGLQIGQAANYQVFEPARAGDTNQPLFGVRSLR
ncbi:MAG: penicillin-binding protein activator [Myxococcota bacterium]|nr:penicillin-binding protein activator [Myxococcota bacterium]